jgi:hypothetical protein
MKAQIAYKVIKLMQNIKMESPFNMNIARSLESICYSMFGLWVVTIIYNIQIKWLSKKVGGLPGASLGDEFILIILILYVFAQIMRRGVQMQKENELTV